jgi:tRNA threonylcarbamoyl adenosine modification protein YeaZ
LPPEPLTLGFDTSAAHCAAALLCGGRLLAVQAEAMPTGQAERLMPMLAGLLAAAGAGWRDVARIGVGTGPGNFTGVRIAVAAARGLALGLGVPAVGVTGFEAHARDLPRPVTVVLPLRRGVVAVQRLPGGAPDLRDAGADPGPGPFAPLLAPADLAVAIARIAAARPPGQPRPAPLYLRPADAAPPADPPPAILP